MVSRFVGLLVCWLPGKCVSRDPFVLKGITIIISPCSTHSPAMERMLRCTMRDMRSTSPKNFAISADPMRVSWKRRGGECGGGV